MSGCVMTNVLSGLAHFDRGGFSSIPLHAQPWFVVRCPAKYSDADKGAGRMTVYGAHSAVQGALTSSRQGKGYPGPNLEWHGGPVLRVVPCDPHIP